MTIYIIKDKLKGKEIFSPIALENDEVAIRMFGNVINTNSIIRNNPED